MAGGNFSAGSGESYRETPVDLEFWRCAMNMELKYPLWQGPLAAAVLEFNPQRLRGKLEKAEEAIANRMQELVPENDNEHERRALLDGITIVQSVKRDRLGACDRAV